MNKGSSTPNIIYKDPFACDEFRKARGKLCCALGSDPNGKLVIMDLEKMRHVLISGDEGTGKTVAINAMLLSMFKRCTPDDLRLILIDPKEDAFINHQRSPFLLTDIITDLDLAIEVLNWCNYEFDRRKKLFAALGRVKSIGEYNEAIKSGKAPTTSVAQETGEQLKFTPLPRIVVVIDELVYLLDQNPEVTELIMRLVGVFDNVGIHMIIATAYNRENTLASLCFAHIAFKIDNDGLPILSRGRQGAEKLSRKWEFLYRSEATEDPIHVLGTYVSNDLIKLATDFYYWKTQARLEFYESILDEEIFESILVSSILDKEEKAQLDEDLQKAMVKFNSENVTIADAVKFVYEETFGIEPIFQRSLDTYRLQDCLCIDFNKATELLEELEEQGFISPRQDEDGNRIIYKKKCEVFLNNYQNGSSDE